MKIRRRAADIAFSAAVRTRARWKCECCGRQYQPGDQGLHCSHIFSRRHRAIRYDPDNAVAHCYACHLRLTSNPLIFADWARRHLGDETVERLARAANRVEKNKARIDERAITKHYRDEVRRLNEHPDSGDRKLMRPACLVLAEHGAAP